MKLLASWEKEASRLIQKEEATAVFIYLKKNILLYFPRLPTGQHYLYQNL